MADIDKGPTFAPMPSQKLLPSFRRATWDGLRKGLIGADWSNACHFAIRIRGAVPIERFTSAFELLVTRHAVLRATLCEIDALPHLSFDGAATQFERHDLTRSGEAGREDEARRIASEAVWRPFDTRIGLCRGVLIEIAPDDRVFGLVVHHFVADAISVSILLREFLQIHRGFPLARPQLQYGDYLLGLGSWLESPAGRSQEQFWRLRLEGAAPMVLRDTDAIGPAPSREHFRLSIELTSAVKALARQIATTPLIVLLAAQKILLARLQCVDDITLGAVITGRESPVLQPVVGYLVDRVYYRTSLHGNPTLADVIDRVRTTVIEAASYQFIRSDVVGEALARVGAPIIAPVFNMTPANVAGAGLATSPSAETPVTPFGLVRPPSRTGPGEGMCYWMSLTDSASGWRGLVRYGGPPLKGFVRDFVNTLEQMVVDSRTRLWSATS